MKRLILYIFIAIWPLTGMGWHEIFNPNIKGLQVILNDDFEALPVLMLGSTDRLHIGFDELSHDYHRFTCHIEPCNPDWTPTEGLFDSDWLDGFNDQPIDLFENSINTIQLYTHYQTTIPNAQTRFKMSGNYKLHIMDEDDEEALCVAFRMTEQAVAIQMGMTTDTDRGLNGAYQQVAMAVKYNDLRVTRPDEQLQIFVMQNGREDNMQASPRPTYTTMQGLQWDHCRQLIFDAGNEYHKFEILNPANIATGLDHVAWDEPTRTWHAYPMPCMPQPNYIYDRDANGAFLLRNSDNREASRTSEYVYIHYRLKPLRRYDNAQVVIRGRWTVENPENYVMEYNEEEQAYEAVILQKLGYYNYQLMLREADGTTRPLPEEGSFFQTENSYQALVYYKAPDGRNWRLVGFQEIRKNED